ncbi:hypothetical protein [Paenibacillus sp. UMB4589-SE434]|uniref:hypothetical protein n=1 Tax=Paenibacillus sp. UMB4589-SE434 TaxID=3046314 RepID=UPI00254E6E04|nr:hypothetical protein [Paenibacillus sp. UMB4589-SE434]MDK8182742.1 hypothetical protein [Paenibacillus sp. UMB4589-SE434]
MKDLLPANVEELTVSTISMPTAPTIHQIPPLVLKLDDINSITLMDKKSAHSLLEMMIIQTGQLPRASITDISDKEYRAWIDMVCNFFDFVGQDSIIKKYSLRGSLPRIAFNIDPWTDDRDGLQPVKRFHTHLYVLEQEVIKTMIETKTSYKEIDSNFQKRRLLDPFSFLGALVLKDMIQSFIDLPPDVRVVDPDPEETVRKGYPVGLNLIVKNGVETLRQKEGIELLYNLNKQIKQRSKEILEKFVGTGEPSPTGTRHKLLPLEVRLDNISRISWLSEHTRMMMADALHGLKDASEQLLRARKRHQELSSYMTTSNGIAYTLSMFPENRINYKSVTALWINICPRLFSDVGGAGLFGCCLVNSVMIQRGEGIFNEKQMQKRWNFQADLRNHMQQQITNYGVLSSLSIQEVDILLAGYSSNKMRDSSIPPNLMEKLVNYYRHKE